MSLFLHKRSRVAVGAAILIALLIAVLSTADRFAGADVALPGRAALVSERFAKHIRRKGHVPSATSRNAALDSMLAAASASAIDGHRIVPNDVTPFDEFASSIDFERLPSESDGIIPLDYIESNPLLACVGCAGLSSTDEALSEFPFRQWSRHDAATGFGFGPVRGVGDSAGGGSAGGGSSSAGGGGFNGGGAISGLNPQPPAGGSGGDGSAGTGGSPSDQPGDSDASDQSNNSGPNGNSSSNENTSSNDNRSSNENESGSGDGENHDISSTPPGGENPPRTVVAVPEPATAALLLLGVGGTAFLRRREGRA